MLLRVDNRLIHGQVIVGWAKTLGIEKIVVANDELAQDKAKLQMIKLAIPKEISVDFFSLNKVSEVYKKGLWKKLDTMILVKSPKEAYHLLLSGIKIDKINIGGLYMEQGCQRIAENIAINRTDKEHLEKIIKLNVKLEGRALPSDEECDISKLLIKFK